MTEILEELKQETGHYYVVCTQCGITCAPLAVDMEAEQFVDFGTPEQRIIPIILRSWECLGCHHRWRRLPTLVGVGLPPLPGAKEGEDEGEKPIARIRYLSRQKKPKTMPYKEWIEMVKKLARAVFGHSNHLSNMGRVLRHPRCFLYAFLYNWKHFGNKKA